MRHDVAMRPARAPVSLFWRIFAANAAVFIAAGLALALGPATVSAPITLREATTLVAGIAGMLVINLALMRRLLAPVTRLTALMRRIDPLAPGQRLQLERQPPELAELAATFNEMLDRLESERRASAHRELAARDAEQRRIAGELHDEIGQRLTVLLLMLANAQTRSDAERERILEEAAELVRGTVDDLRQLTRSLRPEALDELGLNRALAALADSVERRTGVEITRRLRFDGEISPLVGLIVYRIAQEGVTNAVRHAPGAPIALELEGNGSGPLVLRVADGGPGIPPARPAEGGGLRWMAERALVIGADLSVQASGSGTTLTLTVPSGAAA